MGILSDIKNFVCDMVGLDTGNNSNSQGTSKSTYASMPESTATSKEEKEKKETEEWSDVNEPLKFVCNGGLAQCLFCAPPIAQIKTTSTQSLLQGSLWTTAGDSDGKVNFNFLGMCMHPTQQKPLTPPPPCKAVINLKAWSDVSDTNVDGNYAILVKSKIPCAVSGQGLMIMDSGQKASLSQFSPLIQPAKVPVKEKTNKIEEENKPEKIEPASLITPESKKALNSVEWIDKKTSKAIEYILSDSWVKLSIATEGFEKDDKLNITIEEVNNNGIDGSKSRIERIESYKNKELLEINNAFRFGGKSNVLREVKVTVTYPQQNLTIKTTTILKERNGGIWGMSSKDATKVATDIKTVFANARFAAFSTLIMVDINDNKHIAFIPSNSIRSVLADSKLNSDDKLAIEMVSNTINAKHKHEVQYLNKEDDLSKKALEIFGLVPELLAYYKNLGKQPNAGIYGGSVTKDIRKDSFSLIIENDTGATDYYNSTTGKQEESPAKNPLTTLHEIVGHGRSLSLGRGESCQHEDAILFENLLLRIMGFAHIQRNGTDHGTKNQISNTSKQPTFK